jgi:hypothetical protein
MVQNRIANISSDLDARIRETAATLIGGFAKAPTASSTPMVISNHVDCATIQANAAQLSSRNATVVVLSSIGFGIDPLSSSFDATEAAVKAVRDAIERGVLRLPTASEGNLHLHVKIGVPPRITGLTEPLAVDMARIAPLLPTFLKVMPIEVVVGGLFIPPTDASTPTGVCTAVACLTLHQRVAKSSSHSSQPEAIISSPTSVSSPDSPVAPPRTWSEVEQSQHPCHDQHRMQAHDQIRQQLQKLASSHFVAPGDIEKDGFRRSTSIDMLARVSVELQEQQPTSMEGASVPRHISTNSSTSLSLEGGDGFYFNAANNYNYKKLPPGVTPKNNRRLFVRHTYRDHSSEIPAIPEEMELMSHKAPLRTPNAAFPLKLHEILSLIESDGHDDIIGWLPHGRSFKIHKHKEFVETILPKYFVMTKKSSFLRQLNLYGFNRLSGIGSDQGSYYHETFLRGMKFLSRRMQRQKVNGNGIRAAGNPDEEPTLAHFPECPVQAVLRDYAHDTSSHATDTTGDDSLTGHRQCSAVGVQVSFPLKLQRILDKLEAEDKHDVVSWLAHGRAFLVHDPDRFVSEIMPMYFNQTKYSSFQRQLHMYNFQRITAGQDKGAYHNSYFQRGKPALAIKMQRTRVNGKGTRRPGNPHAEPNLYKMESLPGIPFGAIIDVPVDMPGSGSGSYDQLDDASGSGEEN